MSNPPEIKLKRIYEEPSPEDGLRVLVDRLWPRGVRRDRAAVDLWPRDLAPSPELREWFGHDPERFAEFRHRYLAELDARTEALAELAERSAGGPLTLLFAARDRQHNHAVVLAEALASHPGESQARPS